VKDCRNYVGWVSMVGKIIHINHVPVNSEYFGIRMSYIGIVILTAS